MITTTDVQPRLAAQRCVHHGDREAVARCPECRRYFCRECITEHEEKIVCATCLAALSRTASKSVGRWKLGGVLRGSGAVTGVLIAWICFYFAGRVLLAVPSEFHADTLWQQRWLDLLADEDDE